MPTIKTFLLVALVLLLSMLMVGCGMLLSRDTETEEPEMAEKEGELPEWLLLAHRQTDDDTDDEELLKPKDPEEEEDEEEDLGEAIGGAVEEEATDEPAQTEDTRDTADTGPVAPDEVTEEAATGQQEDAREENDEPRPGTMDYIIQKRQETGKTYGEIEAEREAEEAEEEAEKDDEDDDRSWWE